MKRGATVSLVCLVLGAALAGCLGDDEDSRQTGTPEAPPGPEPAKEVIVPVDFQGHIGTSVCVPVGLFCIRIPITPSDDARAEDVAASRLNASLTMEWESDTPIMERLNLEVSARYVDEDNRTRLQEVGNQVGASPIKLEIPWTDLPNGTTQIVVRAEPVGRIVGPVLTVLTLDQDVSIQGELRLQNASAAETTPA